MIIRKARAGDLPDLTSLVREYLAELHSMGHENGPSVRNVDAVIAMFSEVMSGGPGAAVVSLQNGRVVAWSLTVGPETAMESDIGRMAYGIGTYVTSGARKSGVASAMRGKVLGLLGEQGFDFIQSSILASNEAALKSVKRFGFQPVHVTGVTPVRKT